MFKAMVGMACLAVLMAPGTALAQGDDIAEGKTLVSLDQAADLLHHDGRQPERGFV